MPILRLSEFHVFSCSGSGSGSCFDMSGALRVDSKSDRHWQASAYSQAIRLKYHERLLVAPPSLLPFYDGTLNLDQSLSART